MELVNLLIDSATEPRYEAIAILWRLPSDMAESFGEILTPDRKRNEASQSWWTPILQDIHFWVPLIVLLAGLIVLRWIR
jgi:hypothetical protein